MLPTSKSIPGATQPLLLCKFSAPAIKKYFNKFNEHRNAQGSKIIIISSVHTSAEWPNLKSVLQSNSHIERQLHRAK